MQSSPPASPAISRLRRHRALGADGTPERELFPVLGVDFGEIHALGLDRVQHLDAGLHQVGDERRDVPAGVVGDDHIRLGRFGRLHHAGETRFQVFPVKLMRHHDRLLHADIVAEMQQVGAAGRKGGGPLFSQDGDAFEMPFGQRVVGHHADHHLLHAAHVPGGLPDRAVQRNHGGNSACMERLDLPAALLRLRRVEFGVRVRGELLLRRKILHRVVHPAHMHRLRRRLVRHAPDREARAGQELPAGVAALVPVAELLAQEPGPEVAEREFEHVPVIGLLAVNLVEFSFKRRAEIEMHRLKFEPFAPPQLQDIFPLIHRIASAYADC